MTRFLCAFALFLATTSSASATEGLVWKWDGPQRYVIRADIELAAPRLLREEQNREALVARVLFEAATTCSVRNPLGKKAWELDCTLDQVSLSATSGGVGANVLGEVLQDVSDLYADGHVVLQFGRDGRVRSMDLTGLDERTRRINQLYEEMRLYALRGFAALDLQLPRNGDDGGAPWQQKGPRAMELPDTYGTFGSVILAHQVFRNDGAVAFINSAGSGVIGSGETITVNGEERPKNFYDMSINGSARFDTAQGILLDHQYVVESTPTASSNSATGSHGGAYNQTIVLRHIAEGETPQIGPPAVLNPEP